MGQPLVSNLDLAAQQRSSLAKSAAETLLRVLGGTQIYVRMPMPFGDGGNAAQLGLAGAGSEDVLLAPVMVRAIDPLRKELLISAGALLRAREISDIAAARQFFESAIGVVTGGQLLRIVSVESEELGGEAFLYRVECLWAG